MFFSLVRSSVVTLLVGLVASPVFSAAPAVAWTETFANDPLANGRFAVLPAGAANRFSYDTDNARLTAHYNTYEPTAWYHRPIDPTNGRLLGRYDDFTFEVTFRIRGQGFFADPDGFAQIAWGLVNSQTTGPDRAGGSAGPYAYDCLTFDYFPNVSPLYGGPTICSTIVHSNEGAGFFSSIDFPYGAESSINTLAGDEALQPDAIYTAKVAYDGLTQTATVTIRQGNTALTIGAEGSGGAGGPDADPSTIQTIIYISSPFSTDTFALTAWQDTFSPYYASVVADVDFMRIEFDAPPIVAGDLNGDRQLNGLDIGPFSQALLASQPNPAIVYRADFNGDQLLNESDLASFINALLQP